MKEFDAGSSELAVTMLRTQVRMVERTFNESNETIGPEELKPLTSLQDSKLIPRALDPFMPFAEAINFREVDGLIFLKIRLNDRGKKVG